MFCSETRFPSLIFIFTLLRILKTHCPHSHSLTYAPTHPQTHTITPLVRRSEESHSIYERALEDWHADTRGGRFVGLDRELFFDSMFQVADQWTDSTDLEAYIDFLIKLYTRIHAKPEEAWKTWVKLGMLVRQTDFQTGVSKGSGGGDGKAEGAAAQTEDVFNFLGFQAAPGPSVMAEPLPSNKKKSRNNRKTGTRGASHGPGSAASSRPESGSTTRSSIVSTDSLDSQDTFMRSPGSRPGRAKVRTFGAFSDSRVLKEEKRISKNLTRKFTLKEDPNAPPKHQYTINRELKEELVREGTDGFHNDRVRLNQSILKAQQAPKARRGSMSIWSNPKDQGEEDLSARSRESIVAHSRLPTPPQPDTESSLSHYDSPLDGSAPSTAGTYAYLDSSRLSSPLPLLPPSV